MGAFTTRSALTGYSATEPEGTFTTGGALTSHSEGIVTIGGALTGHSEGTLTGPSSNVTSLLLRQ